MNSSFSLVSLSSFYGFHLDCSNLNSLVAPFSAIYNYLTIFLLSMGLRGDYSSNDTRWIVDNIWIDAELPQIDVSLHIHLETPFIPSPCFGRRPLELKYKLTWSWQSRARSGSFSGAKPPNINRLIRRTLGLWSWRQTGLDICKKLAC